MATNSQMLQLFVEQQYPSPVHDVYPLEVDGYLFLDPTADTVVREIDAQKFGGILASAAPGLVPVGLPSNAFVTVHLTPSRGGNEVELYGPSCVASPPIHGMGLLMLRAIEVGMSTTSSAKLSLQRGVGAHVYVDQVTP